MSSSIYDEDLLGDPTTIEEIVEDELEAANVNDNDHNAEDDGNAEAEGNTVPELQTAPEGVAVEPKKKRVVKNPQPKLNPVRLMGPRGIVVLEDTFKDFQFHGKGFEKSDLNQLMKKLEHWAHRLFPKFTFDDCLQKIENLGHKKEVKTYVKRIRMGLVNETEPTLGDEVIEKEDSNEEPVDAFDALIGQQLSASRHSKVHATIDDCPESPTQLQMQPKVVTLTEEQKERMRRNRLLAEQRKLERLKALQMSGTSEIQATCLTGGKSSSGTDENNLDQQSPCNNAATSADVNPPGATSEIQKTSLADDVSSCGIDESNLDQQNACGNAPTSTDANPPAATSKIQKICLTDGKSSCQTDENTLDQQNACDHVPSSTDANLPAATSEIQKTCLTDGKSSCQTDENTLDQQNACDNIVTSADANPPVANQEAAVVN